MIMTDYAPATVLVAFLLSQSSYRAENFECQVDPSWQNSKAILLLLKHALKSKRNVTDLTQSSSFNEIEFEWHQYASTLGHLLARRGQPRTIVSFLMLSQVHSVTSSHRHRLHAQSAQHAMEHTRLISTMTGRQQQHNSKEVRNKLLLSTPRKTL